MQLQHLVLHASCWNPNRASDASVVYLCTQDNVHYASLTVRQTLDYAAKLRMSSRATPEDRERRISSMLRMLKLESE